MTSEPTSRQTANAKSTSGARVTHSHVVAVIDIGATSIRMAIAQIRDSGEVDVLESLTQAVSLGKDVFIEGSINPDTIEDCVRVLNIYRWKIDEYQITDSDRIRVVATSAVREAKNRLAFLDRIYIATGLEIEPFDEAELHRVTFLGVQPQLKHLDLQAGEQVLVCEVGGGSTEALIVNDDTVAYSQTFRLGSMRLRRTLEAFHTPARKLRPVMEVHIGRTVNLLKEELDPNQPLKMLAMGGDLRFAVAQLNGHWNTESPAKLSVAKLDGLLERVVDRSVDELVKEYHLSFPEAETLTPALLIYSHLARTIGVDTIHVANVNLREGLLMEMATSHTWTREFSKQIFRAALELGRKFQFDEAHGLHVAELTRLLFRQLSQLHQLDERYELLLFIAGLLHEIGMFVSHRSLHKHSMYLIRNSDLFGLGKRDLLLVSLVARYHRRASPLPSHEGYADLNREGRVAIAKMASLLRLAKALDDSRTQRVREFQCRISAKQLVIEVPRVDDLSLEQIAMQQSTSLFEEIFGKRVMLRVVRR